MGRHKAAETKARLVVYLTAGDLDLVERMRDGIPASVWVAWLIRQEARRRLGPRPVAPKVRPRTTPPTTASVPKYTLDDPRQKGSPSGPVVNASGEPVVDHPIGEKLSDNWLVEEKP